MPTRGKKLGKRPCTGLQRCKLLSRESRLSAADPQGLRGRSAGVPAVRFRLRMLFVILRAECGLRIRLTRCSIKSSKS